MPPSPRIPLGIGLAAGLAVGFGIALVVGQNGDDPARWLALGIGLGTLLAFLRERHVPRADE